MVKWQELSIEMDRMEEEFFNQFKCQPAELTEESFKATRGMSALCIGWMVTMANMHARTKCFTNAAATRVEELASCVDTAQVKVIALQDDLIKSKEDQLASVRTTVQEEVASVKSAVKTEIRSWSEVAAQNTAQPSFSTARIKKAVKLAVNEEEKSRNMLIFGKPEVMNEDV